MHNSSQLKEEFIKKWIQCLQIYSSSNKKMNLLERKKKIKLSADIAMASAKHPTTSWSKALILSAKTDEFEEDNKILTRKLSGHESKVVAAHHSHKRIRSKKILKKSCRVGNRTKKTRRCRLDLSVSTAKRLVKKRTQVLKKLVPGGESMDEFSIVKEALDYILSLRVQVDVMKNVVNATKVLNKNIE